VITQAMAPNHAPPEFHMSKRLAISMRSGQPHSADTIVIYIGEGQQPAGAGATLFTATGADWAALVDATGFEGKAGQAIDYLIPAGLPSRRLLILGSGKPQDTAPAWTDRGGSLAAKLAALKVKDAAVLLDEPGATPARVSDVAAGLLLRAYRFDRYKAKKPDDAAATPTLQLYVADVAAAEVALVDRMSTVEGTLLARDLVNEPANVLGTLEFAAIAKDFAKLGVVVEELDEPQMRALGMNALLGVAQGSARPPRLVIMQWQGGRPEDAPLAFVGKGVVFDSGGISIKPAGNMEDMKGDMGGAAAVTGLMHALATRKAAVNVIGVIGLVENMPSGTAMRPGDILTAMNGTTIEVVNTDAEGRLVLADALWYTRQRFQPKLMINLATLTGAIIVALGHDHAGLFSNSEPLASQLLAAGLASGEKLWRLPMGPAYEKHIESRFADIKNSGGRPGGSITAAQFLAHFVGDTPWAHLDIAGVALGSPHTETNAAWSSGFGVAVLDAFVRASHEGK
jgi:leucyl aminopeptidase